MQRRAALLFVLILLSGVFSAQSFGFESVEASPWTEKTHIMEKVTHKLGFGVLNVLTGWTAILFEPARQENKWAGLLKGTWRTVTNTAGGAIHAVTFPFPIDVPLPEGGVHFEL